MDDLAIQLRNQQDLVSARNTALLAKKAAQPKNTLRGYNSKRVQFAVRMFLYLPTDCTPY